MFFWVLVSRLLGQEYFVSVGAADDVSCLDERGCNLGTFRKLQAKIGDHVHLRDSVLTKAEFVEVFGMMRDDFAVSGAPTMIVEKGKSSTVSEEYLMAVESREISVNGVSFVSLRCPILRAVKSKVIFQGCSVEGVRSMNSATLLMVDSRCDFVDFRFCNNSLKQMVFVNITGSDVRFHNASFEDNFHIGSKEWSFIHCWQSNVVFEMCSLTKTPAKQYSIVARGSSTVTVQDGYVNGVRGIAVFGIMESSMLNIVDLLVSAECSLVHAIHSEVEITGMIVASLRCQKHMFSLSSADLKLNNSDIRQAVLSTVLNTQGKTSVEVDHVSITESIITGGIALVTGGELILHNSVFEDIQAPNTTSVCRLTDGKLVMNNMSITRVSNASNGTPMIWLTDSFASIANTLVKDNIGGFLWSSASTPLVEYCTFENHICPSAIDSALPQGIVFGVKEMNMRVHGCTFRHCVTSAGIISSSFSSIDISECFFENCTGFRGVAVISDHSTTNLHGCTFLNNYAHSAGIVYGIEGRLNINSCYFDGNRAAVTGSAVYCVGAFHLYMDNVSTGNNQTSILASPVKYGGAYMSDCNVSHAMDEAIEIPNHRVQFENSYFDCRHNCSLGSMPKRSFRGRMTPLERVTIAREELEECLVQNGIGIFPEIYASHVSRQDSVFPDNKPAMSVRGLYKDMVVNSAGKILIPKFGLVILVPLILVIFSANVFMQDKPKTE